MQPYHTLKGSRSLLPSLFLRLVEIQMQPYYTLKGSSSLLPSLLRFVEFQMLPYHTLKGSRSLLPRFFKVCGHSDANLSHFEGVEVTFA